MKIRINIIGNGEPKKVAQSLMSFADTIINLTSAEIETGGDFEDETLSFSYDKQEDDETD